MCAAVLSLGDGMQEYVRSQIGETTDLQIMSVAPRTAREVDGTTIPRPDTLHFGGKEAEALRATLVKPAVVGLTENSIALVTVGGKQRAVAIVGTSANMFAVQNVTVAAGRLFTDEERESRVMLLSSKGTKELAAPGKAPLAIGDSVNIVRRAAISSRSSLPSR